MFLRFVFLSLLVHFSACEFPFFINRCPSSNPNANNCLLNCIRIAFPYLVQGVSDLNLVSSIPFNFNEYPIYPDYNVQVVLTGNSILSNDFNVNRARIDLDQKFWQFEIEASTIKFDLNFTVIIQDDASNHVIEAKGHTTITKKNLNFVYVGNYEIQEKNNVNYMQVTNSIARYTYDKYKQQWSDFRTMNDEPLKGSALHQVRHSLDNFEETLSENESILASRGIENVCNIIFGLVPAESIFS